MAEQIETVVIGGGHSGIAMSYWLRQRGRDHVVLERHRAFERWWSERWDSLTMLIPNWLMSLPGLPYRSDEPDGFMHYLEFLRYLEEYRAFCQPPLRTGVAVGSLDPRNGARRYRLKTDAGPIDATNVVIATGPYQQPIILDYAASLPGDILQVSSRDYRNPDQLPPGAVLVVGGGASGAQIAEELHLTGRTVYLSLGRHRRVPRRYRGRDVTHWLHDMGTYDLPIEVLARPDPLPDAMAMTGVRGGYDLDLRRFAIDGIILLGRLQGAQNGTIDVADDLVENLFIADATYTRFASAVDTYICDNHLEAPPAAPDAPEVANYRAHLHEISELDLGARGISAIVWATGYDYDFGWVHLPVVDANGQPLHRAGITALPGVYFLGLRSLRNTRSSIVSGAGADAGYLAAAITGTLAATANRSTPGNPIPSREARWSGPA